MKKALERLSRRPWLNGLLVLVYFLLVTLPHEQVGLWTVPLRDALGWDDYNRLLLALSGAGLLVYLYFFGKNANHHPARWPLWGYWAVTVLLGAAAMRWLVIINIEAVHFVQYAALAVLLFPLVRQVGETLGWVTLLGALDEAYQYFYLAPQRTNYYDFNDVLLNLLGGAFGLLLVVAAGVKVSRKKKKWWKSPLGWTALGLAVVLTAAFAAGWLQVLPAEGADPRWAIIRQPQVGWWTTVHPGFTFHVVQPVEGLLLTAVLLLFYRPLDRLRRF